MARKRRSDEFDEEDYQEEADSVSSKSLHIPQFGQIPVDTPIRWIDIDESDWPYANPEIEFIRSRFPITLVVLASRWEGIYKNYQIEQMYATRNWDMQRAEYWDDVHAQALANYKAEDAEFQTNILKDDVRRFTNILDRLEGDFNHGTEYEKARGAGSFGYVKIPMKVESAVKLVNAMVNVANLRATRVNIATQISREEKDIGKNIKDVLDNNRISGDQKYQDLLNIAKGGGRVYESMPKEEGNVIDATANIKSFPGAQNVDFNEQVIKRGEESNVKRSRD